MHSYGPVLPKLFLRFVHLPNEIDESFTRLGNSLFGPIRELELTHRPGRSIPCVSHLELPKDVLRHIVFGNGIDDEALVPYRTATWPVLVTFLLKLRKRLRGECL